MNIGDWFDFGREFERRYVQKEINHLIYLI